jgi:hypothetical protein
VARSRRRLGDDEDADRRGERGVVRAAEAWPWTDLQKRLYASLGYERIGASVDFFGPLQ